MFPWSAGRSPRPGPGSSRTALRLFSLGFHLLKLLSPSESADPKHAPVTPLECAVTEKRGRGVLRQNGLLQRLLNLSNRNGSFAQHFPLFPAQLNNRRRQCRSRIPAVQDQRQTGPELLHHLVRARARRKSRDICSP